jgi:hypothetical protein
MFATAASPLNLSHVPCCGLEWLLCDGVAGSLASSGLVCLNISSQKPIFLTRETFICGTSLCPCKSEQYALSAKTECVALQNWTVGVDGLCHNFGCPPSYRLYHTGASLSCFQCSETYANQCNNVTLFETACQGRDFFSFFDTSVLCGGMCGVPRGRAGVLGVPAPAAAAVVALQPTAVSACLPARILPSWGVLPL